jgi:hypothetical protein
MLRPDHDDRTISSVKRGHLTSVICGQQTSVLTQGYRGTGKGNYLAPLPTSLVSSAVASPTGTVTPRSTRSGLPLTCW